MFYTICLILAYLPLIILFPTKVIGIKNIPKKGKFIFCCNHQSNKDILVLGTRIIRRRFKYLAKEELFKNKLVGGFLKALGGYPIKRGEADIKAIKQTLGYLKEDKAVCIFPEGTRMETSEANEIKDGAIVFALRSKSPIVPACLVRFPKAFRRNRLVIGEAFNLSEMEEFKDKKPTPELIELGKTILQQKMGELYSKYQFTKKSKKNKKEGK